MDRYYLALLGEAGAAGIAKAFYVRFKLQSLETAYKQELTHWRYFRGFRRSRLEMPVYYTLFAAGILISLLGLNVTKRVIRRLETGAINFYLQNFRDDKSVEWILEDERHHMQV
ncbi:hypothetical protein GWK48_10625 [Metallosphaera tengchongensis]|uniref:Uncharacterized protein n=1 Tax=Metallosphaera tengchongensis TaxID=1532350 RepID=A0A6N0NVM2_9CREN|nr:hypothetical protein [Metallosphaera tengchongensis]QKR00782.1 hypothetical protein GWK48_10625 [Metallosphaera tengchongensis]